jgi:hypothetical protein
MPFAQLVTEFCEKLVVGLLCYSFSDGFYIMCTAGGVTLN